jgi:hypothetical protein
MMPMTRIRRMAWSVPFVMAVCAVTDLCSVRASSIQI